MTTIRIDEMAELEEDTQKDRFLTFNLGKEEYGIDILYVTEIIGIQDITSIPEMPVYIKGIINLRGKIIPVMDMRLRFQKEAGAYTDRTCVIVVDIQDVSVGLIIDSVSEVLNIPDRDVVPPPRIGNEFHHRYVKGIGKVGDSVKLLLDCEKLLSDDEFDQLSQVS